MTTATLGLGGAATAGPLLVRVLSVSVAGSTLKTGGLAFSSNSTSGSRAIRYHIIAAGNTPHRVVLIPIVLPSTAMVVSHVYCIGSVHHVSSYHKLLLLVKVRLHHLASRRRTTCPICRSGGSQRGFAHAQSCFHQASSWRVGCPGMQV